jgi:hypothetical protein
MKEEAAANVVHCREGSQASNSIVKNAREHSSHS